jgi:hypothetical protein
VSAWITRTIAVALACLQPAQVQLKLFFSFAVYAHHRLRRCFHVSNAATHRCRRTISSPAYRIDTDRANSVCRSRMLFIITSGGGSLEILCAQQAGRVW